MERVVPYGAVLYARFQCWKSVSYARNGEGGDLNQPICFSLHAIADVQGVAALVVDDLVHESAKYAAPLYIIHDLQRLRLLVVYDMIHKGTQEFIFFFR